METEFEQVFLYLSDFATRIESSSEEDLEKLLEVFRMVRKNCAASKEFQTKAASALNYISPIFSWLKINGKDDILNVGLQAVGNMIVQQRENQLKVWINMGTFVRDLLQSPNNKICYVASMILYNILLGISEYLSPTDYAEIIKNILPYRDDSPDFTVFTVELLISLGVTENVYEQLCKNGKLHLLDSIHTMMVEENKSASSRLVPLSSVLYLVEQFKRRNFYILKTSDKYADLLEPCEVSKLLDIVSAASSREQYLPSLQRDRSLLIDCTYVLRSVHMAGKAGNPQLTSLTQLSELTRQMDLNAASAGASADITQSPTFNFKSGLIRLLGNLCWKNVENQDEVREMDGIPLLLDCCHIDARNPLLIQWVVLAVRNLCEGNLKNQAVIASMNREGVVETRLLHELGLTLHESEDKKTIRVVPLKKSNS